MLLNFIIRKLYYNLTKKQNIIEYKDKILCFYNIYHSTGFFLGLPTPLFVIGVIWTES